MNRLYIMIISPFKYRRLHKADESLKPVEQYCQTKNKSAFL